MPTLTEMTVRHQIYLERLKAGFLKDIDPVLRKVDRAIRKHLTALSVEQVNMLSQKELSALLRRIDNELDEIYTGYTEAFLKDLQELSEYEAKNEGKILKKAKVRSVVATSPWNPVLRTPIQATGDLLESFVKDLTATEIARVNREIRKSVTAGRTISQTVTAIRGTKARNYKDGILNSSANEIRTIVRTSTQHVATTSREETWKKSGVKYYQIVATLDSGTSDICKELDGQVFEVGNGPLPPFHPNCRTTVVAYFGEDEGATRSSQFGYVDAELSYFDWLEQQPASFQDEALGPTRGKLFRKVGQDKYRDMGYGQNDFKPLTLAEMRERNPRIFDDL